ncbi:MAG: SUMF1/EgtB/PvdO family nonheme iron enzyme [Acidimicrobiia bacterium]|nr:SUMF1/EgtB/PvdO family nonheme iron enzyme [Acidimicrobiia bacterium]
MPDPALVVLGSPGAGKSTVLRRLELEAALRGIQGGDESAPITLYLPLNQYRSGDDPAGWAADMWEKRAGDLAPLEELVDAGRVLFLLDGLNEMNAAGQSGYRSSVRAWKDFVHATTSGAWGNRFVFSCRSLDYSTPLSSPTLRVPQVRLEPLSNSQVRQYLKLYSPRRWAEIWEHIGGTDHIDMFRSPFFLKLLVDQVEAEGAIPTGRAGLFTGFVRQAVKRELERDNPLFDDEELLTDRDRRSVISWRWSSPVELPDRGILLSALERLAYRMQATVEGGDGWLVQTAYDRALELIDHPAAEEVISAAEALGVLDERELTDEVTFTHQLIQEYFAARHLTAQPEMERLVPPSAIPVHEELAGLGPADPLPPLPGTGWEETVLMAAPMSPDPGRFIEELAEANLVLAGRCAALPELAGLLEPKIRNDLANRLWTDSRRPDIDLRRRVAAGLAVGHLGGPRFERCTGPYGEYLLPPMVEVPGGEYVIGSDGPYEYRGVLYYEEVPAGPVTLQPFALGKFAVTNREWAGFIAGDGYEDERFWPGDEAKAWRSGRDTVVNVRRMARFWRDRFQADPELVEEEYRSDRMERPMYELWLRRMNMTDEEFEAHLREYYPEGRRTEPRHWRDPRFNNPMQPVIGISWFEARAYTLWLAVQSDLPFRLPTEAEWEAAAAGRQRRRFAYGNEFDPLRGNTTETHVRGPTPIGVFPDGDTPEGIADLCGNTYDLTSSLWGDDPIQTSWPYPYDPDDGRENENAPITVSRVGMGGAWYLGEVHARTTYRGRDRYDLRPDEWLNFRGCRVAVTV